MPGTDQGESKMDWESSDKTCLALLNRDRAYPTRWMLNHPHVLNASVAVHNLMIVSIDPVLCVLRVG
jgi:hypothetical protein